MERIMTHEQEIQLAAAFAEEKERERNEKIIAEKDNALAEKDNALIEKDAELAALRAEIERLKSGK